MMLTRSAIAQSAVTLPFKEIALRVEPKVTTLIGDSPGGRLQGMVYVAREIWSNTARGIGVGVEGDISTHEVRFPVAADLLYESMVKDYTPLGVAVRADLGAILPPSGTMAYFAKSAPYVEVGCGLGWLISSRLDMTLAPGYRFSLEPLSLDGPSAVAGRSAFTLSLSVGVAVERHTIWDTGKGF